MPLHDISHAPMRLRRPWSSFLSAWACTITGALNRVLPPRFHAEPRIQLGPRWEIDAAMLEDPSNLERWEGGVATIAWAPPKPPQTFEVDFTNLDVFEIRVV